MASLVSPQYEINVTQPDAMLFVPRDPGATEMTRQRPLVGTAGWTFDACLDEAGIRRKDINICNICGRQPPANDFKRHTDEEITAGLSTLYGWIERLKPSIIVTLGNEAAYALVDDWPTLKNTSGGIRNASGIEDRRGFIWQTEYGKVLTTVHPAFVVRNWVPWRTLLKYDFERAKEDVAQHGSAVVRPQREVVIIT